MAGSWRNRGQVHIGAMSHREVTAISGCTGSIMDPGFKVDHQLYALVAGLGGIHSEQAVGVPGLAWPAGSCTTHKESFISLRGLVGEEESHLGGNEGLISSPWWMNLSKDVKLELQCRRGK